MNEMNEVATSQKEGAISVDELYNIQQLISGLYSSKQRAINKCDIITAVETLKLVRRSGEVNGNTIKHIDNLVIDLLIATIAAKPTFCDDRLFDIFFEYWIPCRSKIETLLMPQNIHIMATKSNGSQSWIKYEQILVKLFTKNLLTAQIIEKEVFLSFKEEWSDEVLDKVASILQTLVDCSKRTNGSDYELMEIVEWLAWFCSKTNEF